MSRVHRRRLLLGARGALPSRVAGLTDAEIGLFYANASVSVKGFCSFLFTSPDENYPLLTNRANGTVRYPGVVRGSMQSRLVSSTFSSFFSNCCLEIQSKL